VPLRVMVRENSGFDTNHGELNAMRRAASAFADIGVDGLVLGFARDGQPLVDQVGEIIDAAPGTRVTYHRAFDTLTDQGSAIEQLSAIRQIDRILTDGVDERMLEMIAATGCVREVHVGRAARPGHDRTARVSADLVRSLRHLAGL
jgi:copper homeostasis protein